MRFYSWLAIAAVLFLCAARSAPMPGGRTETRPCPEPERPAGFKRIVLCLDGTWNNPYKERKRYDEKRRIKQKFLISSNVLKTCRAVLPVADGVRQITYYDIGVGALNKYPGIRNRILKSADGILGGAWGAGFESRIEDAYRFLVHNYEPGDQIFVFGFSRGAATARALTRFIDWMGGLLEKDDDYWAPKFFKEYLKTKGSADAAATRQWIRSKPEKRALEEYRKRSDYLEREDYYNQRVQAAGLERLGEPLRIDVRFLGVWETVLALGSRLFPSDEKWAFHLDESPAPIVRTARQALAIDEKRYDFQPEIWASAAGCQDLEQRWFAGVHTNVGGGFVDEGLANLALAWMLSEAGDKGLGLDWSFLFHYRPYQNDSLHESRRWFYRVKEAVRFKSGKGVRRLLPEHWKGDRKGESIDVKEAGLSMDCSVLRRIAAADLVEEYGPRRRALKNYLTTCRSHDEWLYTGPWAKLRRESSPSEAECLPVLPSVHLTKSGPTVPNERCEASVRVRFVVRDPSFDRTVTPTLGFKLRGGQGQEVAGTSGSRKRLYLEPNSSWELEIEGALFERLAVEPLVARDGQVMVPVRADVGIVVPSLPEGLSRGQVLFSGSPPHPGTVSGGGWIVPAGGHSVTVERGQYAGFSSRISVPRGGEVTLKIAPAR